jgi:Ni,Fe-hydrogenase III large subunit
MKPETSHINMIPGGPPVRLTDIPVLRYSDFSAWIRDHMTVEAVHCVLYYAFPLNGGLKFIAVLADDTSHRFMVTSHETGSTDSMLDSLTPDIPALHLFEREIHENTGIDFAGHPWLKPVRFPHDRRNRLLKPDDYPFYRIDSEELHEVGVGPIHAGVIEPGHFRFICNGEKVLHLEIMLGYQHRGLERLMKEAGTQLRRSVLAEQIAGDTAVGHGDAHSRLIESLAGIIPDEALQTERTIALELERLAIHIGDLAALCTDVAYQFGQVVNEALRTTIINTTQLWCGNRFGKGLVRPGGSRYPLTAPVLEQMLRTLEDTGERFCDITDNIFTSPSVLIRFDGIGTVTRQQALSIGAVGMAARMAGINRDIRASHPSGAYAGLNYEPVILDTGDVLARAQLRNLEARRSIELIKQLAKASLVIPAKAGIAPLTRTASVIPAKASFVIPAKAGIAPLTRTASVIPAKAGIAPPTRTASVIPAKAGIAPPTRTASVIPAKAGTPSLPPQLKPNAFALSVTEGWRGEIAHAAVTGPDGGILHYKIKDPSFHNWMALALAVRNQEISDFPVCNKSFNLSYCGHDL